MPYLNEATDNDNRTGADRKRRSSFVALPLGGNARGLGEKETKDGNKFTSRRVHFLTNAKSPQRSVLPMSERDPNGGGKRSSNDGQNQRERNP